MNVPTSAFHQHDGVIGPTPTVWCGVDVPDGDSPDFAGAGVGSVYAYIDPTNDVATPFVKVKNDGADNDWSRGLGVIRQTVAYSDFTDGGSTAGTLVLDQQIPQHALFQAASVTDITGFAGDTSAVLTIGDGTDADRYNTGTPDVFSDVEAIAMGAPSGTAEHTAAASVTLTVTTAADFTSVSTGGFTISLYYFL